MPAPCRTKRPCWSALPAASARLAAAVFCLVLVGAVTHAQAPTLEEVQRRAAQAEEGAFGSVRFPVDSSSAFPQWRSVWAETRRQSARVEACLRDPGSDPACAERPWRRWASLVRRARGMTGRAQLKLVNDFFNASPYREDGANYGRREAWVSPITFLRRSGDCEDYAIAKYATLRLAGISDARMRIVVIRDRIRAIRHAVLVVELSGGRVVLDSLSNGIFRDQMYTHYEAQYSLNASGQGTHGSAGRD
jgi:predicted transglutaminase-like cysteine proteinase